MAYATTSELKAYLGVSSSADDALLGTLLSAAQDVVERQTGRVFEAAADTTRYFDAVDDVSADARTLHFLADLSQITSVVNGDGSTVAGTAYIRTADGIKLKASSGITWTYNEDPENAIAIVGRWAYSITPPAAVKQATLRLAAYLYRQKDTQTDVGPVMSASGVMVLPARLPKDVDEMLRSFRRLTR